MTRKVLPKWRFAKMVMAEVVNGVQEKIILNSDWHKWQLAKMVNGKILIGKNCISPKCDCLKW